MKMDDELSELTFREKLNLFKDYGFIKEDYCKHNKDWQISSSSIERNVQLPLSVKAKIDYYEKKKNPRVLKSNKVPCPRNHKLQTSWEDIVVANKEIFAQNSTPNHKNLVTDDQETLLSKIHENVNCQSRFRSTANQTQKTFPVGIVNTREDDAKMKVEISQHSQELNKPKVAEVKKHPKVDTPELFRKRRNIANEIRDTEAAFVNKMEITEEFLKLINEKLPELMEKDSAFADIIKAFTFVQFNKVLLDRLNRRLSKWEENPVIADIFNSMGAFLKSLSQFIRQFDKFMENYYNLLEKNTSFKKVVEEFEMSLESKLKMSAYFLCPVQRIPRYPLLMKEYFKAVPTSAPDFADTKKALELLEGVADHSNETKAIDERSQEVFELISSIQNAPDDPKPGRYISKKGRLLKICRKACEERFFVLFNDVLWYMYITPINEYKFRYEIPLVSAVIRRYPSNLEIVPFQIDILGFNKSLGISCKSKDEHECWYSVLHENISAEKNKYESFKDVQVEYTIGHSAPLWVPDWTVTMCSCCKHSFSTFRRRHHCRACGNIMCSDCGQRSLTLEYSKNDKDRVCNICYSKLTNNTLPTETSNSSTLPETYDHFGALEMCDDESKGKWTSFYFIVANNILYQLRARNDVEAINQHVILSYEVYQPSHPIDNCSENQIIVLKKQNLPSFYFKVFKPEEVEEWITAFRKNTELIVDR